MRRYEWPKEMSRRRHNYPADRKRRWTRERLIERIQTWAAAHDGTPPTYDGWHPSKSPHPDWSTPEWPTSLAVQKNFGSWCEGLRAAGFACGMGQRRR